MKGQTLIFDIGKSNKKQFLFDHKLRQIGSNIRRFKELEDWDGYPCDDLEGITSWIKKQTRKVLESKKLNVNKINFSAYGASLVHLDENNQPITPLFNYTRPLPNSIIEKFKEKHDVSGDLILKTGSPDQSFLSSGLQLFWLKQVYPEIYNRIKASLHLPQYLSFLLSGELVSDPSSLGCHTLLWDYERNDYCNWVYEEQIDKKLAPIIPSNSLFKTTLFNKEILIGTGIHDSTAALYPYLQSIQDPFLLLSTGTWNVCFNPFTNDQLSTQEIQNGCLYYQNPNGSPIKASRVFLGNEYKTQIQIIKKHFDVKKGRLKNMPYHAQLVQKLSNRPLKFHFESIPNLPEAPSKTDLSAFENVEEAYHKLMMELVEIQKRFIEMSIGTSNINQIYIDGGFINNQIFLILLKNQFKERLIFITKKPLGAAMGAALIINAQNKKETIFRSKYKLQAI